MKKYILWVTTKDDDGGYSSRWYGWSRNLKLTYEEAVRERAKIKSNFYEVEIEEV